MATQKRNTTKKAALLILVVALFIPLCQEFFTIFEIGRLQGLYEVAPPTTFTLKKWMDGSFQAEKEKYVDQNYGTRNFLVRLSHQLDYSLFNEVHTTTDVIAGQKGMLYGNDYIQSYYGDNYVGDQNVETKCTQLAELQKKLTVQNKTLIVVLAPGKASFYPEYFPGKYLVREKKQNNYEAYTKQLKAKGINVIDMNSWFLTMKGKTPYPVFTELGVHWTSYGASLAYDSLVKYIERKRNIDLPDYTTTYQLSDTLRYPDNDLFLLSNLLFQLPHAKPAYPEIRITNETGKMKPTCLTIGDSYWWTIRKLNNSLFQNQRYWYYNNDAYPESIEDSYNHVQVSSLNFNEIIQQTDVIILLQTESTLYNLGHGFVEKLYKSYTGIEGYAPREKQEKVNNMMKYIRNDKKWMEGIEERSKKENIPVDTILYKDALWQVEHN
jgi:hypothetical protein